ncbi:MAG: hypothetical protein P8X49_01700 [Syntrophobacterales bacterium]|jgi:hypothetical protein
MVKAFPSSAWERGVFFLGTPVVVLAIRRETVLSSSPDIPIRIYYVPWLIPTYARAQAWWTVILVKRGVRLTESLLAHELAHVLQWRVLGVFGFILQYARHFMRRGYEGHPLETVAHLAAQDDDFLNWAREIIKTKKRTGPS